jgi:hypothetical protein
MMFKTFSIAILVGGFMGALALSGCSGKPDAAKSPGPEGGQTAGDHSGWWCKEHGIPEEECSMCSARAAAEFKAKGDWCDEHNRAKSQCFKCDPAKAEKYAKLYEAKYGKQPPAYTE